MCFAKESEVTVEEESIVNRTALLRRIEGTTSAIAGIAPGEKPTGNYAAGTMRGLKKKNREKAHVAEEAE